MSVTKTTMTNPQRPRKTRLIITGRKAEKKIMINARTRRKTKLSTRKRIIQILTRATKTTKTKTTRKTTIIKLQEHHH